FISIPSETVVQGPTTATLVDGKYRVELNGGIIPSNQVAVKLEVTVTDVWGGSAVSSQTYAIDNVAPQATITSPETDAQFVINHNVNITAAITDVVPTEKAVSAGKISSLRESKVKFSASKDGNVQFSASNNNTFAARRLDSNDKSNGSGIYSVKLQIIGPNSVVTVDYPANTQAISYPMTVEVYGDYIINLISVDRVGNQSIETAEFAVVPSSAPIVTFNEINDNGWWLSNNANNSLTFTVVSDLAVTTQANIYAQPSGDLIVGPITVNPNNANNYAVSLASSLIPDEASSIELEIIATDAAGLSGIFTQTYNIDRIAPVITLFSPRNGTELTLTEELTAVTVKAEFMDLTTSITKGQKSQSGSGIANARLVITDPNNNSHITLTETEGETVIETVVTDLMIGTYTAVLTVNDKAGNQVIDQIQFIINPVPVEPAVLEITDAYIYPNPMTTDGGANFKLDLTASANVKIIIYDFAGREVKTIDKYSDAKSSATVEWDGRNNNGTKLARGAYFARIIANDGKKIVETVVKVAITN
ncbi:MAG: FlgD immunoglobulin-like domain containing protein, partial [Bacteroidales bacterium]|nr:FlgD immunoglobulin-like domain containing protein [Bacteroidales bacterium]